MTENLGLGNRAWGYFSAEPITRWLSDGLRMQLMNEDLTYTDPTGQVWVTIPGQIIDGASIPKPLWSLYGGPYEGQYRWASIFHDYVCDTYRSIEERKAGDRMFKQACMCAGCDPVQAEALYAGVCVGTLEAEKEGRNHGPKAFDVPDVPRRPGFWN